MAKRMVKATVKRGWMPTRKWMAAQAVALGGVAVSAIDSGWDGTEWKLLIGIAVQAASTYLLANAPAPGGVPDAEVEIEPLAAPVKRTLQ